MHRRRAASWAALLLIACVAAGVGASTPARGIAAAGSCTPEAGWGTTQPDLATQVVGLVNRHRASLGLAALAVDPALTRAAEWKSLHMANYRYFDHADPAPPVARDSFQRMHDCGSPDGGSHGENIAAGQPTAAAVMSAWIGSPGHRRNLEDPDYRVIGVGVARKAGSPYGIYWTQEFASIASAGSPPPPPPPPPGTSTTAPPPPPSCGGQPGGACTLQASDDRYRVPLRRWTRLRVLHNDRCVGRGDARIVRVRAPNGVRVAVPASGRSLVVKANRGGRLTLRYTLQAAGGLSVSATVRVSVR